MEFTGISSRKERREHRARECMIIPGTNMLIITGLKLDSDTDHPNRVREATINPV